MSHSSEPPRATNTHVSSPDELAASLLGVKQELEVDKMFKACVKLEGSDLHLKVGSAPIVRVKGDLKPLNRPPIEVEEMVRLLIPMLNDRNRRIFEEEGGRGLFLHGQCRR